jgi:LPS sulfotransferase NodH
LLPNEDAAVVSRLTHAAADPAKFLIAGTQRTGTTLLRTSLSSHPEITCHGEVFKLGRVPYSQAGGYWAYSRSSIGNRLRSVLLPRRSCAEYLARLYGEQGGSAIGFKLMLNQCDARPYLWPLIARFPVSCILVTRRNHLKTLVSRLTAAASGVYHVSATLPAKSAVSKWVAQPVVVDAASIIAELDAIADEAARWRDLLSGVRSVEIEYEAYVRDQSAWNARVLDFLGVSQSALSSDLKKVNPDQLATMIVNYDEIADVLAGSSYAFCLTEDR